MKPKFRRIQALLRERGLDGAIASSPENVHYLCGVTGNQHAVSRQPGFCAAAVRADAAAAPHIITMDFEAPALAECLAGSGVEVYSYDTWVGLRSPEALCGGAPTGDVPMVSAFQKLINSLKELDLHHGTLGLEMAFLPEPYLISLRKALPEAHFEDVSELFVFARSIKTEEEIELFQTLCSVADSAFTQVAHMARPGISELDLAFCFRNAVIASGKALPSPWSMFSTGANAAILSSPGPAIIQPAQVVKFDAGVNAGFNFYTTDTSRSWLMPGAPLLLHRIKDRLYQAHSRMLAAITPGLPFSELFRIGYEYVKETFPGYRRGHLGHSISLGPATSEAPFISPGEDRTLEPGMILAVEVPCYMPGMAGFNIEDMILVTENGCVVLTPATPHYI